MDLVAPSANTDRRWMVIANDNTRKPAKIIRVKALQCRCKHWTWHHGFYEDKDTECIGVNKDLSKCKCNSFVPKIYIIKGNTDIITNVNTTYSMTRKEEKLVARY